MARFPKKPHHKPTPPAPPKQQEIPHHGTPAHVVEPPHPGTPATEAPAPPQAQPGTGNPHVALSVPTAVVVFTAIQQLLELLSEAAEMAQEAYERFNHELPKTVKEQVCPPESKE